MSKSIALFLGLSLLVGCASSQTGSDSGMAGAKVAAATCMSNADAQRVTCEQACPTPTGNEHFSVQHKIARENIACKEQCAATKSTMTAQCSTTR